MNQFCNEQTAQHAILATIMVVDDDDAYHTLAAATLEGKGFEVLRFTTALRALEALEAGAQLDVLVTRIRFRAGQLQSNTFARMVGRITPAAKVVLTSAEQEVLVDKSDATLGVPVSMSDLVRTVQQALAERSVRTQQAGRQSG